ncbi:putative reverse transcriptase domain-containing protein [Tanacetum coccineum]
MTFPANIKNTSPTSIYPIPIPNAPPRAAIPHPAAMAAAAAVTITPPPLDVAAMPPSPPLHAPFSPPLRLLSHDSPATPPPSSPRRSHKATPKRGAAGLVLAPKANAVADALSRKERVKPKRVRAMNMILQSSIKDRILAAQKEDMDEFAVLQKGLDEMIKQRSDGTLYYLDRIWVPLKGEVKNMIMEKRICRSTLLRLSIRGDRLTKSAHFLPMRKDYKIERLSRLYLNEIVARYDVPISIISDCDSQFTLRFWQSMQEALGTRWDVHLPLVELSYNNSYHSSVRCAPFEALYGRKCRSPIMWAEIGEGVVRFGKKWKLAPRFVGPFKIIKKVGPVAYRLDLPEELDGVHDTFHVSNLKKCLADPTLQGPLDEIRADDKLNFVEEPVEIIEREFNKLKRSRIAIVKVRCNSKCGPEFTWESEDKMKLKYPRLFSANK